MTRRRMIDVAAVLAMATGLGFALTAPTDRIQGDLYRIMFVHVPSAWLAYVAFATTVVGSVAWLISRGERWDRLAAGSAEVGVFFTGMALATGMIWGKPVWGVWWTWDARLTTTALLFFIYLGYVALRRATPDPVVRARRSAVLGILAFVQVPIVHFSVVWWRSLHQPPTVFRPETVDTGPAMEAGMVVALLVNVAAFTVAYAVLVARAMRAARLEALVEDRAEKSTVAGSLVDAPRLEGVVGDG